jgi:hypothetical protein
MGWYYSERTGLIETDQASFETPDEAFIAYYQIELAILLADKDNLERDLRSVNNKLSTLKEEFGYLVDKYPEEFI